MKVDMVNSGSSAQYASASKGVTDYSTENRVSTVETSAKYSEAQTSDAGDKTPSEDTIKQMVSDINRRINKDTIAEYGYHDKTGRVTIKIVDKESESVIKEYPAEETLDMIAKVWELAGMFLDEKG